MDIDSTKLNKRYIPLEKLEIYILSRELSALGWKIYQSLGTREKNIMGDQFIRSTDSTGANIAEGYSRYHYLDRIRFCYNSRGSLAEANNHWLELLLERKKVQKEKYEKYKEVAEKLSLKLNNFISSIYKSKNSQ